jgi:hypothetical protein
VSYLLLLLLPLLLLLLQVDPAKALSDAEKLKREHKRSLCCH